MKHYRQFVSFSDREVKEGEYFIRERDEQQSPKLTLAEGTRVKFPRYVNRVGYKISKASFTKEDWNAAGRKILIEKSKLPAEDIDRVLKILNLYSPYKALKSEIYGYLVRGAKGKVLETLLKLNNVESRYNLPEKVWKDYIFEFDWRHMWFVDYKPRYAIDHDELDFGEIVGRKRFWTGEYYAPTGGKYWTDYGYEYEYEPGGIYPAYSQSLYIVRSVNSGWDYFVYADDIKEDKE